MKPVAITVKSVLRTDGANEVVQIETSGQFGLKEQTALLFYEESEFFGVPVKTTLRWGPGDRVVLLRSGGVEHRLEIETGRRHMCLYQTRQGMMNLGITGLSLQQNFCASGGVSTIAYELDLQDGLKHINQITITVKEV